MRMEDRWEVKSSDLDWHWSILTLSIYAILDFLIDINAPHVFRHLVEDWLVLLLISGTVAGIPSNQSRDCFLWYCCWSSL
jgi:hypothetical protein